MGLFKQAQCISADSASEASFKRVWLQQMRMQRSCHQAGEKEEVSSSFTKQTCPPVLSRSCDFLHFFPWCVLWRAFQLGNISVMKHIPGTKHSFQGNLFVQAPVLRTLCNRAAFQESSTNEVRISLDSQLHMIREGAASPKQPGDWCRDLG